MINPLLLLLLRFSHCSFNHMTYKNRSCNTSYSARNRCDRINDWLNCRIINITTKLALCIDIDTNIDNSFCLRMMVLAGVLVFGTPAGVLAEEADHSMEGQISKPQSSGESDTEGFVDDSTDNTYGYYTIMGCTTVDAEDMVVQYEAQNVEYPSGILTEGGAPDIDTFCTIVIEEADAEGVLTSGKELPATPPPVVPSPEKLNCTALASPPN